ncbi:MAG: hypothetical protein ACI8RD_001958 [Bacillariaceae sp.]|jgi:hypothetical protein
MQIQQLSTAAAASAGAGFLSSSPPDLRLAAAAVTGGAFFNPGGGFFLVSATLAFLARLRFDAEVDVGDVKAGGLLVDEVAEAAAAAAAANGVVLVLVLILVLVLRFLDLVVGPATAMLVAAAPTLPRANVVGAIFVPTDETGSGLAAACRARE